ncbi:MAG: S24/S26 family peptidase [Eubacteriales bacterium]|nr:S24/S26 family peptidase [Eubacteriales bacterium]
MDEVKNALTFEQYLKEYGTLTYHFHGVSMLPLLRQGKDLCTVVAKGEEKCKKYDVALYKRINDPGTYVLHRIVKLTDYGYVFLGDNCVSYEYIQEEQVIGVMSSFYRGKALFFGKRSISVESPCYKAFSRIWVALFPLRKLYKLTFEVFVRKLKRLFYLLFKVK